MLKRFLNLMIAIILKLVPVKKNRIVFTSFSGHYSDSPKYIARKMKTLKPDADIIWLVEPAYSKEAEKEFKTAPIHTFKGRYYSSSAGIRVDNVFGDSVLGLTSAPLITQAGDMFRRWLRQKRTQKLYTTWHGTPIKRMGRDQIGSNITDFLCRNATMILDNRYTIDIMRRITFDKMKMVQLGLPRNDILFLPDAAKAELKAGLGLPPDKKILLFAPTFRNDSADIAHTNIQRSGLNQLTQIDFEALFAAMNKTFGGDWVFVCRFHYHVSSQVNWEALNQQYPGKIINGNQFDDMSEYLACTDALLTDVSSCSFDFSLTQKPCFLFFPDYDYYKNTERGFYCPVEDLPFPLSKTFDELICNISQFNAETYRRSVLAMLDAFGYTEEKDAAGKIAEYILLENNLL